MWYSTLNFSSARIFERYDWNRFIHWFENPREAIFFSRMSWFIVSKAICKLMRMIPVSRPESKPVNILFAKYQSEVSVEWFLQKPDWYLQTALSSIIIHGLVVSHILKKFRDNWSKWDWSKIFRISLSTFFVQGFKLGYFTVFRKWDSLMDKLQICVMGMPNTAAMELLAI